MARSPVTRCFFLAAALAAFSACASAQPDRPPAPVPAPVSVPPPPAPVVTHPPPTRPDPPRPAPPQLWPTTSLHGLDYIDVRDIAARFGLKPAWSKSDLAMTLGDRSGVRCTFEARQHDFYCEGLRVFLGEPVLREKDSLWVSKLDVIKIVAPLLRPVDRLAVLPAAAPHVIVIDPGHGGSDPGKENRLVGINEKTMTLDTALRLRKLLEAQGWRVILTRTEDRELSPNKKTDLQLRDDLANRSKADLFLSIHFNSVEKEAERVTGLETYAMTPQFMFSAGGEKRDDMTDVAYPGNKLDFANLMLAAHLHRSMLTTLKTPDRGLKHARWGVLRMLNCPGVLIECAYLSNVTEARRVATPEYREKIAEALDAGLQNYAAALAALRPPPLPPPAPAPSPAVAPEK